MITPNKFLPLDQSILGKCFRILDIETDQISLLDLYDKTQQYFIDVSEFLLAIDVLYALNRIDVDLGTGIVSYAN